STRILAAEELARRRGTDASVGGSLRWSKAQEDCSAKPVSLGAAPSDRRRELLIDHGRDHLEFGQRNSAAKGAKKSAARIARR
ncbi:hypothetical protein LSAT2_016694, partial [Lamellibrachia satsuma]